MYYPDQKYIDYLDTMQELLENKRKVCRSRKGYSNRIKN